MYEEFEIQDIRFNNTYVNLPNVFQNDDYKVIKRYLPVPEFDDDGFDILVEDQSRQFILRNNLQKKDAT